MSRLPPPTTCEELLAQMVSFETVNSQFEGPAGGEARLAEHLESLGSAWGLRTERCPVDDSGRFNLLVHTPVRPGAEWLLFESHLDTVSIAGMTVPPLTMTAQGERLHGRGTCDTKGSGAAMLWALKCYHEQSGTAPARNAGVVFVVDEEAGMSGAQAFARHEVSRFARLRGIIVGEPTRLRPVVAHHGAFRWRTVVRGVAAHSAAPEKGRSAIREMLKVIDALETRFIPLANRTFPLTGKAAASINMIRGGTAVNIIPDSCEITCDRRLIPGEAIEDVLAQRAAALEGFAVEHDSEYLAPPLPPESSSALHAWIAPVMTRLGLSAEPAGEPYATDASHYAAAGAQVVVLGPGDLAQAHTRDEWLDRRELTLANRLYLELLLQP